MSQEGSKTILGLDLGTNSIGWALVENPFEDDKGKIIGMGVRIIPMSQDVLGDFGKGNSKSQTAERRGFRSTRRLRERFLLRRERLHRVLNVMGFLPEHYAAKIDFEKRLGQFTRESEPKLAYTSILNESTGKQQHDFIFKKSFEEMLRDFRIHQPDVLLNEKGEALLIPYDWTLFYLRKKALTERIEKEELAWILLNFNQKRGYYQLRGEDEEEDSGKQVEFHSLRVVDVVADEPQRGKSDIWYSLTLENGWVYRRSSKVPLYDWKDKIRDFIVTTDVNEDGTVKTFKDGKEKRNFRAPSEDDWTLRKKKTEKEIDISGKTVGAYIYDSLLQDPKQKIKGHLIRTIERKFYKEELKLILEVQSGFHVELKDTELYARCTRELYENNEAHRNQLASRDFVHLFLNDIIFYQRPLRSQKSSISNCTLEFRKYKDSTGIEQPGFIKCTPKSNPYFQEFRIWQWMRNLSLYSKEDDRNVTTEYLSNSAEWEDLFVYLMNRKEIEQKALFKFLLEKKGLKGKALSAESEKYRWNYVEDKSYPCNETRSLFSTRLAKTEGVAEGFLTRAREQELWHIIYSVTDKIEYGKALKVFAKKHSLDIPSFVKAFEKVPPFPSEYGSYSEKAIKKLLPLMRIGTRWNWEAIDGESQSRITNILTGEYDERIKDRVREKALHFTMEKDFQGLPLWLAQYVIYGRHSEASSTEKWNSVSQLEDYINEFRQYSLRNPIVEQVITETLRVVRDIWKMYGGGAKDFISEIHIELGRDLKNTAQERERISNQVSANENTNLRIKALLTEMLKDSSVENVRPYSPMQQEILKIYEEGVLNSDIEIDDEIAKISKSAQPSSSDLKRYKLWLEQRYRSPYTGEIIPLNKLFTSEYEIEHIIPQSRFFDDSLSNKVICESAVNKLKDNHIGLAFIKKFHGQIVPCGFGRKVKIFDEVNYKEYVSRHYSRNRSKRSKLMMEEIPEQMVERQLNDTRYISKFISSVLSNIVRSSTNDDGINSKNLITGNGKITNELKQHWGLNDVWNDLILPRFERMNKVTNSTDFTAWNENHQKFLPTVPLNLSKGFSKKRIDHRHHAMDALVIACATRDHVNLLNNRHAGSKERFDLNRKLRSFEKVTYNHSITGKRVEREVPKDFIKPWNAFTIDARERLEKIVVSFKQNLRVINKATNRYESYRDENGEIRVNETGQPIKGKVAQKGINWAIRKSLHTPMPYGKKKYDFDILEISKSLNKRHSIIDRELRRKVEEAVISSGGKIALAQKQLKSNPIIGEDGKPILHAAFRITTEKFRKRQPISELSNRGPGGIKTLEDLIKYINKVADFRIRRDLLAHLRESGYNWEIAFSAEGIENFNSTRKCPVHRLPIAESGSGRFSVGTSISKKHKWVEADKGTNLFLAVYQKEDGQRSYETVPLNEVVEHQIQTAHLQKTIKLPLQPNVEKGSFLYAISPNDLVYVPANDEIENIKSIEFAKLNSAQVNRIYKMVSTSQDKLECVPVHYASPIQPNEIGSNNKSQNSVDGVPIKQVCLKLKVDRLGNVSVA